MQSNACSTLKPFNADNMELVSGFLLWFLVDVCGIKSIRGEKSLIRKIVRSIAFILVGFVCVVLYFSIFSSN
jgi:hypothetical protein